MVKGEWIAGIVAKLIALVFVGGFLFVAYGIFAPFLGDTRPAIVKDELAKYAADPARLQSNRSSGQIPAGITPRDEIVSDLISSEVEKNLSTFKASKFKKIANTTGCELFNFVESDKSGIVYLWSDDPAAFNVFVEKGKLVGDIIEEKSKEITESTENEKQYYVAKIELIW